MWVVYEKSCFPMRPENRIAMFAKQNDAEAEAAEKNRLEQFKEQNLSTFSAREEPDNAA